MGAPISLPLRRSSPTFDLAAEALQDALPLFRITADTPPRFAGLRTRP
jgi:hypothetical protein